MSFKFGVNSMLNKNKELVNRFYEAIANEEYDSLYKFCHKDFIFYPQVDTPFKGVEGLIESEKKNFDAFSGSKMPIKELIAERDLVAAYLEFTGTHTGKYLGIEPTNKEVHFSLMMFLKIKDGKIIEKRSHVDVKDVINQLKR